MSSQGATVFAFSFLILNIAIWQQWAKMLYPVLGAGNSMGSDPINIGFWNLFALLIVGGSIVVVIAIGVFISAVIGYVCGWLISYFFKILE